MAEPPVADSSPLIVLARAGLIELLRVAGDEVLVPEAVAVEVRRRGPSDPTLKALASHPWLRIVAVGTVPPVIVAWDLGAGESAVLAWARSHPGCQAILDDEAARRCAASLSVPVKGTLGVVLLAKRRGVVAKARPVLEKIMQAGLYLSDKLMNDALVLVGE